jgi:hypothetical protein
MSGNGKTNAQFNRIRGFADIQFQQNTLYLINSELKSTSGDHLARDLGREQKASRHHQRMFVVYIQLKDCSYNDMLYYDDGNS